MMDSVGITIKTISDILNPVADAVDKVVFVNEDGKGQRPKNTHCVFKVLSIEEGQRNRYDYSQIHDGTKVKRTYRIASRVKISMTFVGAKDDSTSHVYQLCANALDALMIQGMEILNAQNISPWVESSIQDRSIDVMDARIPRAGFDFSISGTRNMDLILDAIDVKATEDKVTGTITG